MPESTTRQLLKRLAKAKIIGESEYAGNRFIYPLHRAFRYSAQHFEWSRKVPSGINTKAEESVLLNDFHRIEYWLHTDTILSRNLDFFPVQDNIFFPQELGNREEGFDYHFDALEWVIKEEQRHSKNRESKEAFEDVEQILNREVPILSREEAIAKAEPQNIDRGQSGMVFLSDEAEKNRKKKNQKRERFWRMDKTFQNLSYAIVMKTLLTNLSKKKVYVTSIRNTRIHSEIDLVVLHNDHDKNHWSTYNNLMTQIQRIYCFQTQSIKINITVVAENEEEKEEVKHLWCKAIDERKKQTGVSFIRRARKNFERKKQGKTLRPITINDIRKYAVRGTKYCGIDQVKFISLELDEQFTDEVYKSKPKKKTEKITFEEIMKNKGSV